MEEIENWEICRKTQIIDVEIDPSKIEALKLSVKKRIEHINTIKVTQDNTSFVIENYYEAIKELLTSLLLKNGLRSKNHKCLISYFYHKYKEHESSSHLIAQLHNLRNRLNYYGELIPKEFYDKHIDDIKDIIGILEKLVQ